jgi:hypothetical protein
MSNDAIIAMTNKLIEIEKSDPVTFAYIQGRVDSLVKQEINKDEKKRRNNDR